MPGFQGLRRRTEVRVKRYGHGHQRARDRAFKALPEWSTCCRCGKPLWKWSVDPKTGKSAVHYDHTEDGTGYQGFAHKRCNEKAGATKGAKIGNQRRGQGLPKRRTLPSPPPQPEKPTGWRSRAW